MQSSVTALAPASLVEDVQQLIAFLAEAVQPEQIYLLNHPLPGATGEAGYVDLLVVVPCKSHIHFEEHQALVEFANLRQRQVTCSLHRADAVRTALAQGHIFYSLSCTPAKLVYSCGRASPLPLTPKQHFQALGERARKVFEPHYSRARAFLDAARHSEDAAIQSFLLHQAAELTYRAILLSLLEKEPHTHSIKALIKHSRRCAPQLNTVFPRDTAEEKQLVHLLEEAYLKSRYTPDFSLDAATLELLFERVGHLQALARQVFEEKLKALY